MAILQFGSSGPDVAKLQQLLTARGFPTGETNGTFGAGTDAAVRAYQRSEKLVADGQVGPVTMASLKGGPAPVRDDTALFTVDVVTKMFPQTPRANVAANLPGVLAAMRAVKLADRTSLLMALATIRAETESFQPVKEGLSRYNTSPGGRPYDLYDCRKDLGNRGAPDGSKFPGRGYVQLTGADNYKRIGADIGVDIFSDPEKANDPVVAAKVLAQFIKSREVPIKNALAEGDLARARRLVNGGSFGLDRFADAFKRGQTALGGVA